MSKRFQGDITSKSNDELLKMVYQFDSGESEQLLEVERELTERNILPNDIYARRQDLIEEERDQIDQKEHASISMQLLGWITSFVFFGIAIGYYYMSARVKSKFSSNTYFKYTEDSRETGRNMFYSSIFITSSLILYLIINFRLL